MDRIGHFREDDARRIGAFFRRRGDRKQSRPSRPRRRVSTDSKPLITIQAPAAGIPAASNYTLGMAECAILRIDDGTLKDSGETADVYSPDTQIRLTEGLRLGWASWDGSQYVFHSALCDDTREFVEPEELNPMVEP